MKHSSGRKLRRALTQPWRERKRRREQTRDQAAFEIDLRQRFMRALKAQEQAQAEQEEREEQSA